MELFKIAAKFMPCISMLFNVCYGQPATGARSAAMASATISISDSWNSNAGAIEEVISPLISLSHELKFNNPEITSSSVLLLLPFRKDLVAVSFSKYGFSEYAEQWFSISYSKKLSSRLSAGIQFNYYHLSVEKYGSSSSLTVGAGIRYALSPAIAFGASILNPSGGGFDPSGNDPLPVKLSFGASCYFSQQLLLCAAIDKQLAFPSDFRIGIEYAPDEWIALRTGVSVNPIQNYFGMGIRNGQFCIDTAVAIHPGLGYSPQISLSYAF